MWGNGREPRIPAADIIKFWETANVGEFLNNPIQLWRVKQDGSVQDALYSSFDIKY